MKTSVKRRAKNCIRGAVLLACFIAVWYVASCFTQPLFIPAPATVWEAIVGLAETGQLQKGLAYSFLRITGASALSMLVAIPLSLLIYGVKPVKETIMPVVSFLRYVPVTAFSPLLILWFGIGEQMKISFLFIATFVYLLPSILLCFNDVPQDLMDTGKTIGMTSWETIKEILLPASLPSIFSTFLMMYGIGWTYCAVVEATNANKGVVNMDVVNVESANLDDLKKRFVEICATINRPGMEDLMAWLERSDFYTAPASTRFHGNYTGGLLEHSLNVYDKLSGFVARYPELEISPETVAVTALFHDLTKVNYYTVSSRNVKDDVTGAWHKEPFYKTEDRLPLGHGEKSVIILQSFIKLTRDEIFAIRWHMGSFDCAVKGGDYSMGNAFETCPLAVMTHLADMEATYLVEGLATK